ncbi:MAG TPA: hypothetical protein VHC22_20580 [Pirellulales bacterium]|nr:hypothetical protein [Pirellulales bacterium]
MSCVEKRRAALADRLGVAPDELEAAAGEEGCTRFQLQPGGYYWVYSSEEEKVAFKEHVPDVPHLGQIYDVEGKSYNVYLVVERTPSSIY